MFFSSPCCVSSTIGGTVWVLFVLCLAWLRAWYGAALICTFLWNRRPNCLIHEVLLRLSELENVIKILTLDFCLARVMMSACAFMIQIVYDMYAHCVYVCLLNQALFQNKSNMWEERCQKEDVWLDHTALNGNTSFSVASLALVIIISSGSTTTIHNDINHGLQPVPCRGCFKETVWRIFPLKHWKLPRTSSWPCVV